MKEYFSDMAAEGLFIEKISDWGFITFRKGPPKRLKYCIDFIDDKNYKNKNLELTEEFKEHKKAYEKAGWNFVCYYYNEQIFIYSSEDINAAPVAWGKITELTKKNQQDTKFSAVLIGMYAFIIIPVFILSLLFNNSINNRLAPYLTVLFASLSCDLLFFIYFFKELRKMKASKENTVYRKVTYKEIIKSRKINLIILLMSLLLNTMISIYNLYFK